MLSLGNVNDARETDAHLKPALTRVTLRRVIHQRPAQIARDRGALMRGQFLAEQQRFTAMPQNRTRHAAACLGFGFESRPEPVELAPSPNTARQNSERTANERSISTDTLEKAPPRSSKCAPSGRIALPARPALPR
jgi:hypothetical protein